MTDCFTGSFTQQEPLNQTAQEAAMAVLQHGRLHRYNVAEGETAEAALLEQEYAAFVGAKFCLAVASGGYAIGCALRALGIGNGDKVLTNAFTLAPVPGAIASVGAEPVFVEVTADLVIDLEHLAKRIAETGARTLLLSHMRGHLCDMDALMEICDANGVQVVEDCAHTMGATWDGTPSGRHGAVACYSTQTYKHINSGEGGLLTTDDPDLMARAVLLSGSYMLYDRHEAAPKGARFERAKFHTPNVSGRMDNLRAAILRPQLENLPEKVIAWNARYRAVEAGLQGVNGMRLITRGGKEGFVGSSIQFLLPGRSAAQVQNLVSRCAARGVELKWFGADAPHGFTSRYDHWRFAETPDLPNTDTVLREILDMRLPLTFSLDDCRLVARIIREEVTAQSVA